MDHPTCPCCEKRALTKKHERHRGVCDRCAVGTGLVVRPPELRPPRPCARCRHRTFVRAVLRDRSASGGDYGGEYVAPLGVSFDTKTKRGGDVVANPDAPLGMLVAYVCRSCGFTELYTAGAAVLPIGPRWGTELVEAGPDDGPYR
jgi:hypothetical protein